MRKILLILTALAFTAEAHAQKLVKFNDSDVNNRVVFFRIFQTDGITPATGEGGSQPQVSTNLSPSPTNTGISVLSSYLGHALYYATLTQTLIGTAGIDMITPSYKDTDTSEAIPVPGSIQVVQFDPHAGTNLGLSALPTAAPGAANGVLIAGTNASVTFTGPMTLSDGMALSRSTPNTSAFTATGNGTGHGALLTGGLTGSGLRFIGGSSAGDGISGSVQSNSLLLSSAISSEIRTGLLTFPRAVAYADLKFVMYNSSTNVKMTTGTVGCRISKDGGAEANCVNVGTIAQVSGTTIGAWRLPSLTAAEMTADSVHVTFTMLNARDVDFEFRVQH